MNIDDIARRSIQTIEASRRPVLRLIWPWAKDRKHPFIAYVQSVTGIEVDGIYGPLTMKAVKRFQRGKGLLDDGIVGKDTWKMIDAEARSPVEGELLTRLKYLVKPFRRARYFGWGRPRGGPNGITWHTAETSETSSIAEALEAAARVGRRKVSWHYAVDLDSITHSVRVTDRAYAAGPGNDTHIHIEIAGRAGQGTPGWSDEYSQRTIDNVSLLTAWLCVTESISIQRLTPSDLLQGKDNGICDHETWSIASARAERQGLKKNPWWNPRRNRFRRTTHMDVGPTFPWDWALERVSIYAAAKDFDNLLFCKG